MSSSAKVAIKNRIVGHGEKPATEFVSNPSNWRKHPKSQLAALRAVLADVGWVQDIIVNNQTGQIIDGHARVELALLNKESVPYVAVDLSPEEEKLILSTLDPLSAMASSDKDKLEALLREVSTEDTAITALLENLARSVGIKLGEDVDAEPQIDKAEELREEWGVKTGDLWQLGEHRLICGDCTDPAIVARLMGADRAILFATDPPYLVNYNGMNHPGCKDWSSSYGNVHWDERGKGDSFLLWDRCIQIAITHAVKENAAWYWWHASCHQAKLEGIWNQSGAFVHQQIIWVKTMPVLTRSWYSWQHEPCLMGWVKGHQPPKVVRNKQRSVWFERDDGGWVDADGNSGFDDIQDVPSSVWRIENNTLGTVRLHPTIKPVEIFEIPMQSHVMPGEICYEPFSGSGSQIMAAERLGRCCRAVELNPGYVAVALQRFLDASGKPPALVNR